MAKNRVLPELYIKTVSIDEEGAYAKVQAIFSDEEIMIRLALDLFTYKSLKKAMTIRYFDRLPGLDYQYKLLFSYGCHPLKKEYTGYIECMLGKQCKSLEFSCSKAFVDMIESMSKMRSIGEWRNFT